MPLKKYSPGGCTTCLCSGSGGGGPGVITGCTCQGTPLDLSLTISYGAGQTAATFQHSYQDCTLRYYYPSLAPYHSFYDSSPNAYLSTTTWFDDAGYERFFALLCVGSRYDLALGGRRPTDPGYPDLGSAGGPDGAVYHWTIGGANTCSPFSLTARGTGGDTFFLGKMFLSG